MGWSIHKKIAKDEKVFRKLITSYYGRLACGSIFAFIFGFSLLSIILPRLRASKYGISYSSKRPSTSYYIPLKYTVALWVVCLPYFIFSDTNEDFIFLAKRLGKIPVALLPAVYFLSLRPSPLPRTFYLQLLPLHKWLSRIAVFLMVAHGLVYTVVYAKQTKLAKLLKLGNISGACALLLFVAIGLSSLKPIRRRFYNVFYGIHYISAWLTLPLLWYHSKSTRPYVYFSVTILISQAIYRIATSRHVRLPVQYVSPSMFFISIPRNQLPKSMQRYFSPGSHLRVSNPLYCFGTWLQSSHPYTIASLPQDPHLTLVIRKTTFPIKLRRFYALTGPYSSIPCSFFEDVNRGLVNRALFIAGGTGIAFCAPIMRYLRSMNIPVKLLWAIRDVKDVQVLETLGLCDAALVHDQIEVYVTRGGNLGEALGLPTPWYIDDELNVEVDDDCCGGGEFKPLLNEHDKLLENYTDEFSAPARPDFSRIMFSSRPVLNLRIKSWLFGVPVDSNTCCCLDQLMEFRQDLDPEGRWVLASGAETLVGHTQKWADDNGFSFFKDEFSM